MPRLCNIQLMIATKATIKIIMKPPAFFNIFVALDMFSVCRNKEVERFDTNYSLMMQEVR